LNGSCGRLASVLRSTLTPPSMVSRRWLHETGPWRSVDQNRRAEEPPRTFDPALLEFLVCPLSKKLLRYEASTRELINEELGIAYPIIDAIPNTIPQEARMTHQSQKQEEMEQLAAFSGESKAHHLSCQRNTQLLHLAISFRLVVISQVHRNTYSASIFQMPVKGIWRFISLLLSNR
ncbi:protein preY, mitochondrial-like, partial [Choloepus didactylus]|uniref:protein preY, mitochondrial-like n=1 Tax=Choloepus didactylus TaxID=27675 RepID=UPI00189FE951